MSMHIGFQQMRPFKFVFHLSGLGVEAPQVSFDLVYHSFQFIICTMVELFCERMNEEC